MSKPVKVVTTIAHLQAAFTEWDRRYREDPEAFANAAYELLYGNPETYGEAAAPYFLSVLADVSK